MSNKVAVLVYSRRLGSPIRKAVMVYFAERASDNGEGIWASKATIANAIECGRSTVIRTIKEFVQEGLLREVGKRPCRNGETTEYAIVLDAIERLQNVDQSQSGTSPNAGPVPERDGDQSQSGTPTSPAAGPKPSREPSVEPSENPPNPPAPKARLPDDWVPDPESWDYAKGLLGLTDTEIEDIANDFRIYWTERRDSGARKSERGWKQTWRNRCRDVAPSYKRNRQMAGGSQPARGRQGTGIVGAVARRQFQR